MTSVEATGERPSWDEYFMTLANQVATRTTCLRRAVGAVIVKDRRILATGYNGVPSGIRHCAEVGCLREQLGVPSGQRHEICRGLHVHASGGGGDLAGVRRLSAARRGAVEVLRSAAGAASPFPLSDVPLAPDLRDFVSLALRAEKDWVSFVEFGRLRPRARPTAEGRLWFFRSF